MKEEFPMPISLDWSKEEIIDVTEFFQTIEMAYSKAVAREDILSAYNRFKAVVPAKSEEKQHFRDFDKNAGVSCWNTVQKAQKAGQGEKIKME